MGFDVEALRAAVAAHGRVARVVVAEVAGSAPREVGAAMLVWPGGQSGTIGGGALELAAAEAALTREGLTRHPLGPALGQCCGGAVTLLTEHFDAAALAALDGQEVVARGPGAQPLAVARLLDRARGQGLPPEPQLVQGWMVEPVARPARSLWVWGAGHVGRAIVATLAGVPELAITWVDTGPERFPAEVSAGVTVVPAAEPARLVRHAPRDAEHLILTYSHELDFALCHGLLAHGFGFAGLIGSETKWARFRSRLLTLGHADAQIMRICCPIGQKSLGKHPQAIAIGVAAQLLGRQTGDRACQTHFSASGA
ncbi:MAG: xanthine dehydrogenase accessory protein XdhC [Rhodobacteraceae bacterium]|jgi:xanthine dehydrogenase accessory factor|uniref:Molybdenum cofactor sulfurylase n=3 Tax=Salipiger TaxID=263377 RepID=A0A1U7D657_9RHOB|nr:xanthine dehydrogenase accessory protein XdhC [Salipiger profundus]APX23550.1 molybdenum cofactor sulfurylase [Salipiger profundus]MAB08682.1 xanthine dehydrogenase accessory protein XdhC [Paracoccaceae bacterium]GGA21065.1 xanthine dehydrogenase accessory protein XdhC [Salipiger profundus]SFC78225.1 molybdenum cofactor sulfurylase [Salipiger profundus]